MSAKNLKDLLLEELRDLYSAEKQILSALAKLAKAASSDELKEAFEEHHAQTEGQVARLEEVFELLGVAARAKRCEGIAGIIEEGSEFAKDKSLDPSVRDAALIASAQKVEHYEIASYGTVRTWAHLLGQDEAADLLQQTLDEESDTDEKLTSIAAEINVEAEEPEHVERATSGSRGRRR